MFYLRWNPANIWKHFILQNSNYGILCSLYYYWELWLFIITQNYEVLAPFYVTLKGTMDIHAISSYSIYSNDCDLTFIAPGIYTLCFLTIMFPCLWLDISSYSVQTLFQRWLQVSIDRENLKPINCLSCSVQNGNACFIIHGNGVWKGHCISPYVTAGENKLIKMWGNLVSLGVLIIHNGLRTGSLCCQSKLTYIRVSQNWTRGLYHWHKNRKQSCFTLHTEGDELKV